MESVADADTRPPALPPRTPKVGREGSAPQILGSP